MFKSKSVFLVLMLFISCIAVGCGGGGIVRKVKTTIPPVSTQPYTLGPMDKIAVTLRVLPIIKFDVGMETPNINSIDNNYTINYQGKIRFPILGEIDCLGLTTYELADLLEEELECYIRTPYVRVELIEYNSRKVIIMGAVKTPGMYYVKNRLSLMEAIALAGGLQRGAKATQIYIGRGELDNLRLLRVNVKNIMTRGRKDKDILLQNGDIIFVPTTFVANINEAIQQLSPTLGMYNTLNE